MPEWRPTALSMAIEELAKFQESETPVNNNSPPAKRIKPTETADLMEAMIDDFDERRKSFEESDLKKAEDVS